MAVKGKGKQIAGKAPISSPSSSRKRKNPRADGESSGARPKKKLSGVSKFVDDAAADADFEVEEEDDDLEWEVDDDFEFDLSDIGSKEIKNVTKVPRKSTMLPFFIKEEEMDDDELEMAIMERYHGSRFASSDKDVKDFDKYESMMHATKELSVWRVKCMMGRERQAAFCLMQKFVDLLKIGKKLQLFSVFALDHVKGFVYVEADKSSNVFEACNGLCILYPSRIEFVPRNEAPNLLSIQKKASGISKGMWVRMKSGKYKGDLAEVVLVNDAKKMVTIKLVPRVDLPAIAKKFGGGISLKAAATPAPRLISSHELEDFRPHIEIRRDRDTGEIFEILDGLMLKDGYLYKKVSMASLIHWGVQPSSAELTKFEDLSLDETKNVSWLSSIYKDRAKKKLPETSVQKDEGKSNQKDDGKSNQKDGGKSNPKYGDKSNQKYSDKSDRKDAYKPRSGFDIDALVLFGKKDCGIILDHENETFKILKGDAKGAEVVNINIRAIRKNCIDKVFTATDRGMKTISIGDVVKVSEGPLEGRVGIARHMYKGFLFLYDECQSENNGFFCAMAQICDLVKKTRDFYSGKSGSSKEHASFDPSPIELSDHEENSQSFSRNRQSNSRGTFSVGQTLRICKGPLKGYLCRVIRIHRADVTVKLDSLGKLLTVDEKLLSVSRRDDAISLQSDMFGLQEEQPAGNGLEMENFEFQAGMPSFGRDSWNAPSSSSLPSNIENESKDHNEGSDDPWGNKLSSGNGDQEQGAADGWGKPSSSTAPNSSWNKCESGEKGADAWNDASSKGEASAGGWENDNSASKTGQICSVKGEDGWNGAEFKPLTLGNAETGGWEKAGLTSSDAGGSWNTKGFTTDWNVETSGKNKTDDFGGQSGNWASPKSCVGANQDSWGVKGKGLLENNENSWDRSVASLKTAMSSNGWETSEQAGGTKTSWKKAANEDGNQSHSWEKVKSHLPSSSSWEKSETVATETDGGSWKTNTNGNQVSGWGSSPSSSGWQNSKPADSTAKEGWKKDVQIDGWNKDASSDKDQESVWNKAADGGRKDVMMTDSWDKPKNSESRDFGREGRKEWKTGDAWCKDKDDSNFNKSKDSDCGLGSGWSQGRSNNENGNNWGHDNGFDGRRGSGRGRGRGRYGGRGDRNQDDFEKSGHSDGNFGRGRGRGRFGGGGYNRDSSDSREFGRGRGRWQGRGRGQGQGQSESSDWRNGQDRFDDGGFSNKLSSSWGNSEGSGWGKSKDDHSGGAMAEKDGWNSWNSNGGGSTNGWGTDSQNAVISKNATNMDGWSKSASTSKPIDTGSNDDAKTLENKISSWNQTNNNVCEEKGTTTTNSTEVSFSDWAHGCPEATTNEDKWTTAKPSSSCHGNTFEKPSSNDWCKTSVSKKEDEDGDDQGGWVGKNANTPASHPLSENENNSGKWMEPCSGGTVDGTPNPGSLKGWGDGNSGNWESRSGALDFGKETFGNQSSNQDDGGGNRWSNQSGGRGRARGSSYFGRGGERGGRSWGRGRDSSFSFRGHRGGRNSGERQSHGWNGGSGSGNDGGQTWNKEHTANEGEEKNWNGGGSAEKSSWGSWTSKGENPSAGRDLGSKTGWDSQTDFISTEASGWESASAVSAGKTNWDFPTSLGSNVASGSNTPAKEPAAVNVEAENEKEASDDADAAHGWSSTKGDGPNEQKNDPWGSSDAKQKNHSAETDQVPEGSLPVGTEAPKWQAASSSSWDSSQNEGPSRQNDTAGVSEPSSSLGGELNQSLGNADSSWGNSGW